MSIAATVNETRTRVLARLEKSSFLAPALIRLTVGVVFAVTGLVLAIVGPGAPSLDALIARRLASATPAPMPTLRPAEITPSNA